jgi:hypothetical protein
MSDVRLSHPSAEQLLAFTMNRLGTQEMERIHSHLSACESCRRLLREHEPETLAAPPNLPPATVVFPPRDSKGSDSPVRPSAPTAGPGPAPVERDVPAELANHPRYRVLQLLGAGGMGSVYKAEHRLMERLVALKVINPTLINLPGAVERFHLEVKAAARLVHPNIVTAYDAEQVGDAHFLVMEFVEGWSLAKVVEKKGRLPVAHACDYIRQAALGLQHAFEQGMVHRDIKPHNLMLTSKGRVKILDFGLARFVSETGKSGALTSVGAFMGTPDYIAPEQAADAHGADIRADIYSLGCTFYQFLAGRLPFPDGTTVQKIIAHMEETPKPVSAVRDDVLPGLVGILDRMMAKQPAQRFQTPVEVARALSVYATPGTASLSDAARKDSAVALSAAPAPQSDTAPLALAPQVNGESDAVTALRTEAGEAPARKRPAQTSRRTGQTKAGPRPVLLAGAALVLAVISLAGLAFYRSATNTAELTVQSQAGDLEVVIKQQGKYVKSIDSGATSPAVLNAGDYDLELVGSRGEWQLSANKITLGRGDKKAIEIVRATPVASRSPALPPPISGPEGELDARPADATPRPPVGEIPGRREATPPPPATPGGEKPPASRGGGKPLQLAWPSDLLRAGKIHNPPLKGVKPTFDDEFKNPRSGFPRGKAPKGDHGYTGGKYVVRLKGGPAHVAWNSPASHLTNVACRVNARVTGDPAGSWGLFLNNYQQKRGIVVAIDGEGKLWVKPSPWEAEKQRGPQVGPVTHPAVKGGDAINRLLVVVHNRVVEIYVNGVAVCDPVVVDRDFTPAVLALGAFSREKEVRAEFERVTVWPADGLPMPEARGAVAKR